MNLIIKKNYMNLFIKKHYTSLFIKKKAVYKFSDYLKTLYKFNY